MESSQSYDLVIVGSGLAGLSAALEANNHNLSIFLIEKEMYLGGNSMKATSGINLLLTKAQSENGIKDSLESFITDTMNSSKNLSNPELVKILAEGATEVMDFLSKYEIDLPLVSLLGGHSKPRTHRPKDKPVGATICSILINFITKNTKIKVATNTTAVELLVDSDKKIKGITIIDNKEPNTLIEIQAKNIILASGGFAHDFSDNSLIKEFVPEFMDYPTTNGPQAEGRGLKMARSLGAGLIHMEHIQLHPTGFVDPADRFCKKKILAPELMRGVGGILMNSAGERFCDELGTRDYVTDKIRTHGNKFEKQIEAILVIPEEAKEIYGKNFDFYVAKKYLSFYKNWDNLSEVLDVDKLGVKKTLEKYEKVQKEGGQDEFGKSVFPGSFQFDKPVYAGRITPSIHYTMGGLKIDDKTRVLKQNGEPIVGLFGAGEVTGGVHGGNRLGANSLLECVVFGRRAGRMVGELEKKKI